MSDETFISRWSRKKTAAKAGTEGPTADVPAEPAPAFLKPGAGIQSPSHISEPSPPVVLPPVESLTPESDFTPFMGKDVDGALRQRALKTLFQDPRFNMMDGLDVYIDDYSKPDPLPEGWLEKMNQATRLGEYREPEAAAAGLPGEVPGEVRDAAGVPANEAILPPVDADAASDTSAAAQPVPSVKES